MEHLPNYQYYKDKDSKIRQKLPDIGDPTANLRKIMSERPHPRMKGLTLSAVSPDQVNTITKKLEKLKKLWFGQFRH